MRNKKLIRFTSIVLVVLIPVSAFAAVDVPSEESELVAEEKKDKSGTNPINFQRDFRLYNEYSWLNGVGSGDQNLTTAEFRTPFLDGKWQFRTRVRYTTLTADFNNDGVNDIDESGFGDIDMRFLTVPVLNLAEARAIAVGLEVFLDTASENTLGSGTTSFGPQVFFVKFFKRGLFAPALQYKFSVDEDDGRSKTDQVLIDLNVLFMTKDKQSWFFADPQIIFDNETDAEFAIIDVEFGWMLSKWFDGLKGHSFYIRPSVGVGADRPSDGSIEIGYKIVGW